ncbi:hypothetical protein [Devosia submarina]|uniref:hypothetical protein n=1 Tax=Devosia submarina TaxID=1173082 RepID=UPI0013003D84|nr:hypothetical protein [Devosia submarina]
MPPLLRLIGISALALLATACVARPVGDFGRAEPSFTHDTLLPAIGDNRARERGEPVSSLNRTDGEEEMHNRIWRFLVAPHAKDWMFDASTELQRTRIVAARDGEWTIERYYDWLETTSYRSSRTRYSTVGAHVQSDIDTLPTTFAAICAVIEIDRQRTISYAQLRGGVPPRLQQEVAARKAENSASISWFVRALNYRYDSYDFALDNLLVATPHEQSLAVDETLRRLSPFVARANRGDFCSGQGAGRANGEIIIPSRYQRTGDREIVLQK